MIRRKLTSDYKVDCRGDVWTVAHKDTGEVFSRSASFDAAIREFSRELARRIEGMNGGNNAKYDGDC